MAPRRQPETTAGQAAEQREQARKQFQHAEELWLKAQRTAQRHVRQARKLRAEGRIEDAIVDFREAIRSFPSASAHLDLAAALLDVGCGDEAFAEYLRAMQIDPHPTDRYVELGVAFHQAGQMEMLLSPFTEVFGEAPLEALRALASPDPVEAFVHTTPDRRRYAYRFYLERFLEDLRPACVWEALSIPAEELVGHLMGLYDPSRLPPEIAKEGISTAVAFLRFVRNLGFLPDDAELNEWLEEDEAESAKPDQVED